MFSEIIMTHEEEENELSKIASTKCQRALDDISDDVVECGDCGFDELHDTIDSISLGLRKSKSKQKLWTILPDENVAYLIIAKSYKEIKNKINSLDNRLTKQQQEEFINRIQLLIPNCRFAEFESPEINECRFIVDADTNNWHGKIIDGIRLVACIDPKHYLKKPKGNDNGKNRNINKSTRNSSTPNNTRRNIKEKKTNMRKR